MWLWWLCTLDLKLFESSPSASSAPPPLAAAAFVITGGACQGPAAIKGLAAALLAPASDGRMRSMVSTPHQSDSWAGWRLLYRELADNHQQPTSFSNLNQQTSYLRISSVHLKLAENYIVPSYLYLSLRSPSVPVIVSRSAADPYSTPQRAGQLQAQGQLQHLFEY
jgi:hypothetical protein